ncbi:MAG: c-type cytochrome [Gemmatimonadetes bacterium]|nr:c-type cytochrome [Gemmatimonadota bacterium]
MSKDTNQVLGHADESDGIEEYDNPLPDWWLGLLWLTVIWAVGYAVHYHFIGNRSQEGRLAREMQAAETQWPVEAAAAVSFAITPEAVAAGEVVYTQNCLMCHGAALEGGIGSALNDAEWIHGGDSESVIRIITEGVPEKGMLTWGPILGPEKINQVAAYVLDKNAEYVGEPDDSEDAGQAENSEEAGEEG